MDNKKGFVDYKLFEDEMDEIIEKGHLNEEKKKKVKKDVEEPKIKASDISVRPSPNLPTDPRYSMKNTVVGRHPEARKGDKSKGKISQSILKEIIKATYLRDKFIEDAFAKFATGRNKVISQDGLKDALDYLGVPMTQKEVVSLHLKLRGDESELTAEGIDLAVEDLALRGIEEIQKDILDQVNYAKAQNSISLQEAFMPHDKNGSGFVSFQGFKN